MVALLMSNECACRDDELCEASDNRLDRTRLVGLLCVHHQARVLSWRCLVSLSSNRPAEMVILRLGLRLSGLGVCTVAFARGKFAAPPPAPTPLSFCVRHREDLVDPG